jgi:hypothetical protein
VHETQDRIDIALVNLATGQLWKLAVIDAVHEAAHSAMRPELASDKLGQGTILKAP